MDLYLKTALTQDIEAIVALDKLCFGGIWTADGYLREIDSPNSSLLLLWLEANQQLKLVGLGCLWSIVEEAHITLLGIHPEHQRLGLGKTLLCYLLEDALKRQLERATLEVRASNQAAIKLYEQYGFKLAGKRKNYYPQTGEDALILWLNGLDKTEFAQSLQQWQKQISDRYNLNLAIQT